MRNLLVTIFGGILLILGFYGMSFGFSSPPNFGLFFGGLCAAVFGIMLMILYATKVDLSRPNVEKPKATTSKVTPKHVDIKPRKGEIDSIGKNIKPAAKPKSSQKIKPKPKQVSVDKTKPRVTPEKIKEPIFTDKISEPVAADKNEPRVTPEKIKEPIFTDKISEPVAADKTKPPVTEKPLKKIVPTTKRPVPKRIIKEPEELTKKERELETATPPEFLNEKPKKIVPVSKASKPKVPLSNNLISKDGDFPIKPVLLKESGSKKPIEAATRPVPKHIDASKLKSAKRSEKDDQEFVKNRLKRMKESYLKNSEDIESIIDERLDSFKGTLDTLKSESQEPSIIWSFDAGDVQDALKDTIDKAQTKILMMYPWIRNVDVSILKKFMDTESRMIIQEASLDDDTSVELIKLLLENDVKIRTMPHIHTVAVVSDNNNGLIISTDPIYESFEVGVMYKDQKSIEEIERLFEDAWALSKDLDMEYTQ
jgi:hypothetical protein